MKKTIIFLGLIISLITSFFYGVELVYASTVVQNVKVSPVVTGSNNVIYTTSDSLFIEYSVNSDIDIAECVVVGKNNSSGLVANLNANVIKKNSNTWTCSIETSSVGYTLNSGNSYTFTPIAKLDPNSGASPSTFEGDKKSILVDYEKPTSSVISLEKYDYYDQLCIDVYFEGSDDLNLEWFELYYRVDGGSWKKVDQLVGKADLMVGADIPYQFFPQVNGKENGKYDFYSIAIDYAGNKESKSPTVEQGIVVDDFIDEESDTEPEDEGYPPSSQSSNNNTSNNTPQDNESEEVVDEETSQQDDNQADINKKEESKDKKDENKQSESLEDVNTEKENSRGIWFWILIISFFVLTILIAVGVFFQIKYKWINAVIVKLKNLRKRIWKKK